MNTNEYIKEPCPKCGRRKLHYTHKIRSGTERQRNQNDLYCDHCKKYWKELKDGLGGCEFC